MKRVHPPTMFIISLFILITICLVIIIDRMDYHMPLIGIWVFLTPLIGSHLLNFHQFSLTGDGIILRNRYLSRWFTDLQAQYDFKNINSIVLIHQGGSASPCYYLLVNDATMRILPNMSEMEIDTIVEGYREYHPGEMNTKPVYHPKNTFFMGKGLHIMVAKHEMISEITHNLEMNLKKFQYLNLSVFFGIAILLIFIIASFWYSQYNLLDVIVIGALSFSLILFGYRYNTFDIEGAIGKYLDYATRPKG